jgi:hypothetical protein
MSAENLGRLIGTLIERFRLGDVGELVGVAFACAGVLFGYYGFTWITSAIPPVGAHQKFWYPATFEDAAILVLLCVVALFAPGMMHLGSPFPAFGGTQQPTAPYLGGGIRSQDGSENARYLAVGCAALAVVVFALCRSQADLAFKGRSSLLQFFAMLPWRWREMSLLSQVGLGANRGACRVWAVARHDRHCRAVPSDGFAPWCWKYRLADCLCRSVVVGRVRA